MALVADVEVEHEFPGVGKDGSESDRFGDADECCSPLESRFRSEVTEACEGAGQRLTEQEELCGRELVWVPRSSLGCK